VVVLGHCERERLELLARAGSTPQSLAFRCRLLLRLAQPDQPTNLLVAEQLGCNRNTVEKWRHRYLRDGLAGLQDAPRSGRPRSFSPLGPS
jgi:hypothetical protein